MYNNVHNSESSMKQVTFTEFRRNAAAFFSSVERGETVRILRHGKPIAEIIPLPAPRATLSWKRPGPALIPGSRRGSLSKEILRERNNSRS
jgi:antitoxin (DNA-binding transcriptional repressor) of toxin-antitoxin stability system